MCQTLLSFFFLEAWAGSSGACRTERASPTRGSCRYNEMMRLRPCQMDRQALGITACSMTRAHGEDVALAKVLRPRSILP